MASSWRHAQDKLLVLEEQLMMQKSVSAAFSLSFSVCVCVCMFVRMWVSLHHTFSALQEMEDNPGEVTAEVEENLENLLREVCMYVCHSERMAHIIHMYYLYVADRGS